MLVMVGAEGDILELGLHMRRELLACRRQVHCQTLDNLNIPLSFLAKLILHPGQTLVRPWPCQTATLA